MNFVGTVSEQGDEMLTLLSMEKQMVECILPSATLINVTKTPIIHLFHNSPRPLSIPEIKVRSKHVASPTKKHGGMQHPRPVVPTKSGHPKSDRRYKSRMRNITTSHFSAITKQQSFLHNYTNIRNNLQHYLHEIKRN